MVYLIGGNRATGIIKKTIANNLTGGLSGQSHRVLLIETDVERTATLFTQIRYESLHGQIGCRKKKSISAELACAYPVLRKEYSLIVIDLDSKYRLTETGSSNTPDIAFTPYLPLTFNMGLFNSSFTN